MSDVLDAWVQQNLSVGDVERWHTRLRRAGMRDAGVRNQHGVLRAAVVRAVRWGWASTNMASTARLRSTKTLRRTVIAAVASDVVGLRPEHAKSGSPTIR